MLNVKKTGKGLIYHVNKDDWELNSDQFSEWERRLGEIILWFWIEKLTCVNFLR
jgi:hypothetical protein